LHGRNHAYLSFTLRHEKINDLSLLMQYPLLTSVDVCHNNLFTLEALSAMPYLWTVKAAHNEVTTAIDFAAPRPELAATGDSSIGSSLRELDLAWNHVSVLEDRMGRHPLLTRLNLSHNKLTGNLSALRPLRLLRFLDASHNQLTSDFGIAGLPLEEVNLAENCLRVVDQVGLLPALVDLDLHNNQVASLYGLRDANRCARNIDFTLLAVFFLPFVPISLFAHYFVCN
jgi:Leucine-rich repeat (LRR) protein